MQVLNSVDGKSDAHEYFQKMILVYGAVYDLSDFPHLFLERVVALLNYFEPQVCKKPKSKLIDSSLNIFDRVMSQFLISCKILLLIK